MWIHLIAFAISAMVAFKLAALAFARVFGSYNNHDSAAPLLIAVPVALAVFVLVLAGLQWLISRLLRRLARPSGRD